MLRHRRSRHHWPALALVLAVATCEVDAQPAVTAPQPLPTWLAGCWRHVQGATTIDEWWMPPAGDGMLGMSRTLRDGSLRAWELLRLTRTNGNVAYVAQPSGQAATTFPAVEASADGITFALPSHDFPQRIRYRRWSTDRVTAEVGNPGGRSFTLDYARVSCDAAA
jgi:hypothetical protein